MQAPPPHQPARKGCVAALRQALPDKVAILSGDDSMTLPALAVVAGATVILSDPIFQGLAIALMAGSLISMFTAPVLVPLLYFMANNRMKGR